jgi:signal transduction histidine kinase
MLAERCGFLRLTAEDLDNVRALGPFLRATARDFIDGFYDHLKRFPSTAVFLRDERLVQRLKGTQLAYLESLLRADLGPAWVADRRRIGERHAEVGLEPPWFLGTFSLYIQHAFTSIESLPAAEHGSPFAGLRSLMKLILLDIGLALDAYYDRSTNNLRQALALYTQSNTELREFARLASHDLKTPLATIAGLCEEFLDEFGATTPPEGRQLIQAARERTLKMKGMIDELLAISEAAAQPGQRRRVSLRGLVDEALERVRVDYGRTSIEVVVPDDMPEVVAHPARLREVLFHLLANAVKYIDKEPGRVELGVTTHAGQIHLRISDNGPGIEAADLDRIFAPFRRLAKHRQIPGHGLGLYVVRQIVEEQGGKVWCESAVGVGSVFHIVLPAS